MGSTITGLATRAKTAFIETGFLEYCTLPVASAVQKNAMLGKMDLTVDAKVSPIGF